MGKCACLLNSSVYSCKGPQDFVNGNRMYAGQTQNMRRLIFVFSISYFFLRHRSQILTAKPQPRSQCQSPLYSINANYRPVIVQLLKSLI